MADQSLTQALTFIFDRTHTLDNWITPLEDAIRDVTAEEAARKPAPDQASIWEIANHVTSWSDDLLKTLRDGPTADPEDWPAPKQLDEQAWQTTRATLLNTLTELRATIASQAQPSLVQLNPDGQSSHLTHILSILIHNAYHTGQITKLRKTPGG